MTSRLRFFWGDSCSNVSCIPMTFRLRQCLSGDMSVTLVLFMEMVLSREHFLSGEISSTLVLSRCMFSSCEQFPSGAMVLTLVLFM